MKEKTAHLGIHVTREDIIHSFDNAKGTNGSIAILKGNLAPEGSVIKHTACPKNMFTATLHAKPYDSEEACIAAVLHGEVKPGDAIFIRYEARAAAVCRRCSTPARPSAPTRSWPPV